MILTLRNGYPYPYHDGLSGAQVEALCLAAPETTMALAGVVHFEWLHTVTVAFESAQSRHAAQCVTGWPAWDERAHVLEAITSAADGYAHPVIVADGRAYCGFQLAFADAVALGSAAVAPPYLDAIPDFGLRDVVLPEGFVGQSWHKNTCPSFELADPRAPDAEWPWMSVFIDHRNPGDRDSPAQPRFHLYLRDDQENPAVRSDNWTDVLARIAEERNPAGNVDRIDR